ncbi:Predicted ATP-dependent carboligase, ATP-grasp superfamily [Aquiflexum balticum DSM 16537]|uniref:Predicted ATP-dependent carboligase, ATP-grasp superfamily n=1 Tax=Aquiflexum balticum DSM 16537 TaxID=758820 RepID=A0A1W2HBQ1_9BACT|nr:ATP-grasp domain-containing protein [Aquiflexum balticum]SMD46287.1 Predicted ATP-dependent carboligase, ATP-grasp superfamily [Aquiflexum balticum DSM 16537]
MSGQLVKLIRKDSRDFDILRKIILSVFALTFKQSGLPVIKNAKMKESDQTHSVLIPDGERSIIISILNCASHFKNIRLYVMSTMNDLPFRYSRYIYRFIYFPETKSDSEWIANINKVTMEHAIDVIMPLWETAIKVILKNKDLLRNPEKLVPLPSYQNFMIASSKDLLADHLDRFGIPGPKTTPLTLNLLEDKNRFELNFPVLAKPLKSGSGRGIVKFKDFETLASYFELHGLNEAYILQEFLKGADYGCNLLCHEGEILAYTIQKGNLWDPEKPYSAQIGLDFIYNDKLYQTVKKLMKSLNWSGIADLDLLHDEENDVFNIVEINPRFWATLTAALMAGINYPYLLILMTIKKNIEPQTYKQIPYVSLKGLKQLFVKNKAYIFKTSFIWQSTPLKYRLGDPVPIAYRFIRNTKNTISKKVKCFF